MYFIDAYTIYIHILYRYICHIALCVLHIPHFIRHFIAFCSAFCAAHYLSLAPSCFVLYCCCCCFVASALFAYQLKMRPVNIWQFVNRHSAPPSPPSLNLTLINVATLFFFCILATLKIVRTCCNCGTYKHKHKSATSCRQNCLSIWATGLRIECELEAEIGMQSKVVSRGFVVLTT